MRLALDRAVTIYSWVQHCKYQGRLYIVISNLVHILGRWVTAPCSTKLYHACQSDFNSTHLVLSNVTDTWSQQNVSCSLIVCSKVLVMCSLMCLTILFLQYTTPLVPVVSSKLFLLPASHRLPELAAIPVGTASGDHKWDLDQPPSTGPTSFLARPS